jgi:NitT/TauT family transport system ATP-binding protein
MNQPIIEVINVCHSFQKADHQDRLVLDRVNFSLKSNEIIAILGRSGSGKSTLLRIIAGLIKPTSGKVLYRGQEIQKPMQGIAMVFQSFALLPWLTVLQNVELGLEALGVSRDERRSRALQAIDTIGLDGFESAYPKELSGGMRQRVGFARALVVNPDVLLMDEPFSALDVLTADNLKTDLIDLWADKKTNTNGILFVTHNIEEAALLADRILIFKSDPGTLHAELAVKLEHPRNEQDPVFRKIVDQVYTLMTTDLKSDRSLDYGIRHKKIGLGYRLPDADISELMGLIETVHAPEYAGRIDLPELADILHLNIDDLFPLVEVLEILRFAFVSKGDIELSYAGKQFAEADILERKNIFASHLLRYVPLVKHIRQVLDSTLHHRENKKRFLDELESYLSDDEAERVLRLVIEWGRYAEVFAYDDNIGMLSLENPD